MAQYMLLLHSDPKEATDMPREKMMELIRRYSAWASALREKGKLVSSEKLAPGRVRHIRLKDGAPVASDGPYAEAKDVIGGYFMVEAASDAEAETIARECPHLWGSNWVELRPVDEMAVAQAKAGG